MDADGTHCPEDLPRLLKALEKADMVVGSRFTSGGTDERPSHARTWLSRATATFLRLLLGVTLADPTSGFRAFTRRALEAIEPETFASRGPEIVEEVLLRARRRALRIIEVPIQMKPRQGGRSKLGLGLLVRVLWRVLRLRVLDSRRFGTQV